MSCKPPKPFWLYAIELRELHKLPDMEQAKEAADDLWVEMPEDGRFFYRQCSKGLVAEPAKAAFLEARRSSLANPAPNSPASTEILRVKLAVANMENRGLKNDLAQFRSDRRRLQIRTDRQIRDLSEELAALRTSSAQSKSSEDSCVCLSSASLDGDWSDCSHRRLHDQLKTFDDWHSQTSTELSQMRDKRVELVKENYSLKLQLDAAKAEAKASRRAVSPDWPED